MTVVSGSHIVTCFEEGAKSMLSSEPTEPAKAAALGGTIMSEGASGGAFRSCFILGALLDELVAERGGPLKQLTGCSRTGLHHGSGGDEGLSEPGATVDAWKASGC